ncbi:MAG TPA: hypothetical protein VGQ34_06785, partial [Sphingomicrobium sp.]|nr:hypothetical protein [Sphingomicrobium sp.]
MIERLSISGEDGDWPVVGKRWGHEILSRSRAGNPAAQAYALDNQLARLRWVLASDQAREVVTGRRKRELFFAARDLGDLCEGIKASTSGETISRKFAPVGEKTALLKGL